MTRADAALKAYGDGSVEVGWARLAAEYAPVSEVTRSGDELAQRREENERRFLGEGWDERAEQSAANMDHENEQNEPEPT